MFDFDTVYKKHGETFMWDILENWERNNNVRHEAPMTLEARWESFIQATNDNLSPMTTASAVA